MNQFFRQLIGTVFLSVVATVAMAEGAKIAFVSTDIILREAKAAKDAQTKLEREFGERERAIVTQEQNLRKLAESFERDAPTLSEAQRGNRQKQINDQGRDLDRKKREFQEDLNARRNEELAGVIENANRVVKQVAETDKIDLVVQEAVYVNPKLDITKKVLDALNALPPRR